MYTGTALAAERSVNGWRTRWTILSARVCRDLSDVAKGGDGAKPETAKENRPGPKAFGPGSRMP